MTGKVKVRAAVAGIVVNFTLLLWYLRHKRIGNSSTDRGRRFQVAVPSLRARAFRGSAGDGPEVKLVAVVSVTCIEW
jgi:hypothetical protein